MASRGRTPVQGAPSRSCRSRFGAETIQGYLHLPTTEKPVPWSSSSGGIDSLQVDFLNFYFKCLEPHGIGMLSLDMPGTGYAEHWPLVQDTSRLHQAVLNLPLGGGLGRSPAHRHGGVPPRRQCGGPSRLRRAIRLGPWSASVPGINQVFTNQEMFARCPRMMRDGLANWLGGRGPVGSAAHQVSGLLPKTQGLLGSRTSPCRY